MAATVQDAVNVLKRKEVVAGVISFGIGVGVGYIWGKRRAMVQDAVVVGRITEDNNLVVKHDHPEPKVEVAIIEVVEPELAETIMVNGVPVEQVSAQLENWDYPTELSSRNADKPYVVSRDEFFDDEKGYDQRTVTYFSGDDILVDEDEKPIYNMRELLGDESLKFGHGSGDPKVVYMRNDKRRTEYEVLHDPGLYSREVLGLEIEPNDRVEGLKHSNDRVRKFRRE